jgi:hypothetical protein
MAAAIAVIPSQQPEGCAVTIHLINHKGQSEDFYKLTTPGAHDGDTFILSGKNASIGIWGLADTTLMFLGNNQRAVIATTQPHGGTTTIYDEGHGTQFNFIEGTGNITIYDFQHDKTGYIHAQMQSPITVHLTASSDGHGGTLLTAPGLKIDLVGDKHVLASQHS